ncbi:hypothetical protein KEH51_08670 [[Brevibacterium] frigoritolerans]|uniref:Periplasmic binding protein/LacI sugar binding domain-containing protein n=1 Tax=Peribacillus frigoritolerans TaxID=450367 RepID=A0A941FN51_9BACI|nr:hypothetical protein [Peribacillus frigoritolerans]
MYDGHPSGAEDICSQNGYNLMICNSDNNPEKERGYFDMLLSHRIDGLIIHTTGGNHDMLKQMQEQRPRSSFWIGRCQILKSIR